jgi:hypothetical protein
MTDLKIELHAKLRVARATMLAKLDGLSEYDMRRPMTPTGTNLLGLVKHLVGVEYVYLGDTMHRPPPETLPWNDDRSVLESADMWSKADEPSEYIVALYHAGNDANFADDVDWPTYLAEVQRAADAFSSER